MSSDGCFGTLPSIAPSPGLQVESEYMDDGHPSKVNLAMHVLCDESGTPFPRESLKQASALVMAESSLYNCVPITGLPSFLIASQCLCFGITLQEQLYPNLATIQTVSGSAALRLGADLLRRLPKVPRVHLPSPIYDEHHDIFTAAGLSCHTYPYYEVFHHTIQLEAMAQELSKIPRHSAVVLHACAHAPTGCDPTQDEWHRLIELCEKYELIPFVIMSFQGVTSGHTAVDAFLPRALSTSRIPSFIVAQSFSHTFGPFGERIGALHVKCPSVTERERVMLHLTELLRLSYGTPPILPALVATKVLSDSAIRSRWKRELREMAARLHELRTHLVAELGRAGSTKQWDHLTAGAGTMSISGLTEDEVQQLRIHHHVYMDPQGSLLFSGLNSRNIIYVAHALTDVTS